MTDIELKQLKKQKKHANLNVRLPEETKEILNEIAGEKETTISKIVENYLYSLIRRSGKKTKI